MLSSSLTEPPALVVDILGEAAGHDAIHHQAMAERGPQARRTRSRNTAQCASIREKSSVVADGADVADMIGEPLQFRIDRAQMEARAGASPFRRRLDGMRERQA